MQAEEALARRIKFEREQRGWSPSGLASRLSKIGCPMTQSGIWKIENGEPRRRITFDEAVAFAQVFEVDLEQLATDPAADRAREAALIARRIWEEVSNIEGEGWELRSWLGRFDDASAEGDLVDIIHREIQLKLDEEGWEGKQWGRLAYDGLTPAIGRESADAFIERARYLGRVTEAKVGG